MESTVSVQEQTGQSKNQKRVYNFDYHKHIHLLCKLLI